MKFNWGRKLVLVKTFNNEVSAILAQNYLQSAGIEAVVLKDDVGGELGVHLSLGVRLMVDQENVDAALDLLHEADASQSRRQSS